MTLVSTGVNFHSTLGALLIGFSVSCGVFGVLTQQTVTYYQRYFHDKLWYKLMVGALWTVQFVDLIFVGYSVYHYTITHFGDLTYFLTHDIIWSLIVQIMIGALVGIAVKICFVLRVWTFSQKNLYITGFLGLLIVGQAGLALVYCVKAFQIRRIDRAHELKTIATLSLAAGVVTDIVIATSLCYFLRKLRTGFKKSDSLVNMLCVYAINTGAVTSALSALVLILYNVYSTALYFMGTYFILGNLYAISFICTLNTRRVVRGKGTEQQGNSSGENSRSNAVFMITNPGGANTRRSNHQVGPQSIVNNKGMEIGVRREIITDIESAEEFSSGASAKDV